MKRMNKILFLFLFIIFCSISSLNMNEKIEAQDIPELHMIVFQGDVHLPASTAKTSALDGYLLEAKVNGNVLGSIVIGQHISGRYSGLELGPSLSDEGGEISFWIGDQMAIEKATFGPLTVGGSYCQGCTWSLPISKTLNLHFQNIPLPTPTPAPSSVQPSFITGTLIFGSILSAPEGVSIMEAYIGDELVGKGSVSGSEFSITIDPGTENYLGKLVEFNIAGYDSKTTYRFVADDFLTDFKLFFPEYIPPTATATPTPLPTAVPPPPTATSTPEPTRTPTPVPEATATYTPTATPTPIVMSSSSSNELIMEDSDSGGCNSRGGGPASVGLIVLSLAPVYLLNRNRNRKRKRL